MEANQLEKKEGDRSSAWIEKRQNQERKESGEKNLLDPGINGI
ncbi:hypothetical protein GCM10007863_46110 [Dyella mobilis]|uniref:Uncharacterized protein n=1 Tax=Zoogloea oryzae TaxID=310767 RepID=A0ABQ6FL86_9RHOO|nr:hypothetical protein GCM10007863_46110 [Dyella mobilis]GLT24830.1 hypothetical protein GCM10007933_43420 [Zoogloea oryzae]